MQQMEQQGRHQLSGLPKITEIGDVYRIGSLCKIKASKDKSKGQELPYVLNLYPLYKAELTEFIDPVAPLSRVITRTIVEEKLREHDLKPQEMILYKFLQQSYTKCFEIAPDQKFKDYMKFVEKNFDPSFIGSFVNMICTQMALPAYVNKYKFLIDADRHQLQSVYQAEKTEEQIGQILELFNDFVNKIDIWTKLENQYDFKNDQSKTQKKLEEIYESLKKHFTPDKDEKQEQVKALMAELEGKIVPEHVMKVINEEIQKFIQMEKNHSENQVTRNYIDALVKMPFGVRSEENYDLQAARKILDENHYGMDEVKQRILEFIAVGKLRNTV